MLEKNRKGKRTQTLNPAQTQPSSPTHLLSFPRPICFHLHLVQLALPAQPAPRPAPCHTARSNPAAHRPSPPASASARAERSAARSRPRRPLPLRARPHQPAPALSCALPLSPSLPAGPTSQLRPLRLRAAQQRLPRDLRCDSARARTPKSPGPPL